MKIDLRNYDKIELTNIEFYPDGTILLNDGDIQLSIESILKIQKMYEEYVKIYKVLEEK